MKLKALIQTTCAVAAFTAVTAFADLKSEIVGKWSDADGTENIEYKADGTFSETVGGEQMKGKYSFPDATHIKAELEGPMAAMGAITSSIKISGDTMEMAGEEGQPALNTRASKLKRNKQRLENFIIGGRASRVRRFAVQPAHSRFLPWNCPHPLEHSQPAT